MYQQFADEATNAQCDTKSRPEHTSLSVELAIKKVIQVHLLKGISFQGSNRSYIMHCLLSESAVPFSFHRRYRFTMNFQCQSVRPTSLLFFHQHSLKVADEQPRPVCNCRTRLRLRYGVCEVESNAGNCCPLLLTCSTGQISSQREKRDILPSRKTHSRQYPSKEEGTSINS